MKVKIAVLVIVLAIGYIVMANTENPRSMGSALSGIQEAILGLSGEPEIEAKEWYVDNFIISPAQNDSLFVVPANRQFVIRRLYAIPETLSVDWHLAADQASILDGSINLVGTQTGSAGGHIYSFKHDFPDGCLTVDSNETLNVVNSSSSGLTVTIIGYYRAMP